MPLKNDVQDYNDAVLSATADVYVIMLDSNDAKPEAWNATSFFQEYLDLCQILYHQPQQPILYFVVPPPFYPQFGNNELKPSVVNEQLPNLIPQVVNKCGLSSNHLIDAFHALGGEKLTMPEAFCDRKLV